MRPRVVAEWAEGELLLRHLGIAGDEPPHEKPRRPRLRLAQDPERVASRVRAGPVVERQRDVLSLVPGAPERIAELDEALDGGGLLGRFRRVRGRHALDAPARAGLALRRLRARGPAEGGEDSGRDPGDNDAAGHDSHEPAPLDLAPAMRAHRRTVARG